MYNVFLSKDCNWCCYKILLCFNPIKPIDKSKSQIKGVSIWYFFSVLLSVMLVNVSKIRFIIVKQKRMCMSK